MRTFFVHSQEDWDRLTLHRVPDHSVIVLMSPIRTGPDVVALGDRVTIQGVAVTGPAIPIDLADIDDMIPPPVAPPVPSDLALLVSLSVEVRRIRRART